MKFCKESIVLKNILKVVIVSLVAIVGWPLYLMSYFIPRRSNKYVFGVYASNFSGNVSALYLDENFARDCVKIFLYKDKSIKKILDTLPENQSRDYCSIFSIKGVYHALTAGCYIYSNYISDISFWLSNGSIAFNVWHGTPLKTIERDIRVGKYSTKNRREHVLKYVFPYFYVRPDKMLVCSDYEKKCFKSAFNLKEDVEHVCSFPPRLNKVKGEIGTDEKDIVLYCPTWRDDGSFIFQNVVDVDHLNNLMREMNLVFVIKPHPSDKVEHLSVDYTNVILESRRVDVYDLLPKSVLLVTDYSSMLFDATYCGIPTVLFCPDLEQYQRESRGFYTSIQDLGLPVVVTEDDLLEKINNVNNINTSYSGNKYFDVYENRKIFI